MPTLLILIIITAYFAVCAIQARLRKPGSDHYAHISMIRAIKRRNHRMFLVHPQHISETYNAYPLLYHWFLSFFPLPLLEKQHWIIGNIVGTLQLLFFLCFATSLYPEIQTGSEFSHYLLISSLAYILTPISFASWNAKNIGLSARGFGLMLGLVFLYFIVWHHISGNIVFVILATLIALLIFLGSQFAAQMMILSAPLFALLFMNPIYLIIPLLAFLLFYLLFPKICRNYCVGQYWHKYLFCRYMSAAFLWEHRPSVWRDFIYDAWVRPGIKNKLTYLFQNPIVNILTGIPLISVSFCLFVLYADTRAVIISNPVYTTLSLTVIALFTISILTSFKYTRFLGEPQRYVEFGIPLVAVLALAISETHTAIFVITLTCATVLAVMELVQSMLKGRSTTGDQKISEMIDIAERINEMDPPEKRSVSIISNNILFMNVAIAQFERMNALIPNINALHTGRHHYCEVFPEKFGQISMRAIFEMIAESRIEWFVLDTRRADKHEIDEHSDSISMQETFSTGPYRVFRICFVN